MLEITLQIHQLTVNYKASCDRIMLSNFPIWLIQFTERSTI